MHIGPGWNQHLLVSGLTDWVNLPWRGKWEGPINLATEPAAWLTTPGAHMDKGVVKGRVFLALQKAQSTQGRCFPHHVCAVSLWPPSQAPFMFTSLSGFLFLQPDNLQDKSCTRLRRWLLWHYLKAAGISSTLNKCSWISPFSCQAVSHLAVERGTPYMGCSRVGPQPYALWTSLLTRKMKTTLALTSLFAENIKWGIQI